MSLLTGQRDWVHLMGFIEKIKSPGRFGITGVTALVIIGITAFVVTVFVR